MKRILIVHNAFITARWFRVDNKQNEDELHASASSKSREKISLLDSVG